MAGILLYTAAPDSEGTLGGLVRAKVRPRPSVGISNKLSRACEFALPTPCVPNTGQIFTVGYPGSMLSRMPVFPGNPVSVSNRYLDRSVLVNTFLAAAQPSSNRRNG